uniref:Uncharacterized protein n=1 Tax=Oryza meridionalis TaxID=40149 RepID=A0A0E0F4T9_9ORYZ
MEELGEASLVLSLTVGGGAEMLRMGFNGIDWLQRGGGGVVLEVEAQSRSAMRTAAPVGSGCGGDRRCEQWRQRHDLWSMA